MSGGGGEASSPVNGGEFLLKLLQKPPHHPPPQAQLSQPSHDPAVAALGPSLPVALDPLPPWLHQHHHNSPPPFAPHNFFVQNPNVNPVRIFNSTSPPGFIQGFEQQQNVQFGYNSSAEDVRKLGVLGPNHKPSPAQQQEQKGLIFGSFGANECIINGSASENPLISEHLKGKMRMPLLKEGREVTLGSTRRLNGLEVENQQNPGREWPGSVSLSRVHERSGSKNTDAVNYGRQGNNGHNYGAMQPPGFSGQQMARVNREYANRRNFEQIGERGRNNYVAARHLGEKNERERERRYVPKNERINGDSRVADQLDCPGPVPGSNFHSVSASHIEESMMELPCEDNDRGETMGIGMREKMRDDQKGHGDLDDLEEQLADSLGLEDESGEGSNNNKHHGTRDKVISLHINFLLFCYSCSAEIKFYTLFPMPKT